jgi:alanine-synthesizing transaminase
MEEFPRIQRLPPYVFAQVDELKITARRKGEDIIDLGMGNPDLPTPKHIVDKLVEAVQNPRNHRYSASKGIYKLRLAITDWYRRKYDVELNPDTEAIATIGSKDGIAHLALATLGAGDVVFVPDPTYPIHSFCVVIAGGDLRSIPLTEDEDFFERLQAATKLTWPKPKMLIINFPHNPTTKIVLFSKRWWISPGRTNSWWCMTWPMPIWSSTGMRPPASSRSPVQRSWRWSSTPSLRATACPAGGWALPWGTGG